ncbi:hypothetical protein HPP05_40655 [Corallococcus exiguus]|uniref:hypothetical protein n=1 Tax=Corallococcus exiguus TaxID=83462 RepID=UPI001494E688|nr:hypothetical protein [Corallococcus exiguus]NPC76058.1 hypothetical protein [Corallococcus exiguus]
MTEIDEKPARALLSRLAHELAPDVLEMRRAAKDLCERLIRLTAADTVVQMKAPAFDENYADDESVEMTVQGGGKAKLIYQAKDRQFIVIAGARRDPAPLGFDPVRREFVFIDLNAPVGIRLHRRTEDLESVTALEAAITTLWSACMQSSAPA